MGGLLALLLRRSLLCRDLRLLALTILLALGAQLRRLGSLPNVIDIPSLGLVRLTLNWRLWLFGRRLYLWLLLLLLGLLLSLLFEAALLLIVLVLAILPRLLSAVSSASLVFVIFMEVATVVTILRGLVLQSILGSLWFNVYGRWGLLRPLFIL